ncbi:hypothetical protein [Egbenema bharatensis]|uniref:hypothetical protein n=1 Tax=Egbenema bharatensis TaxID=3463334 RepID=UPI003A8758D9
MPASVAQIMAKFQPILIFKSIQLRTVRLVVRSAALSLAILLLIGGGAGGFGLLTPTAAATPLPVSTVTVAQAPDIPDLDHAANKAEEASDRIYEGLDRTKAVVGKTEPRNQVIEEAREHASEKWLSLAEKTREAKRSDGESLSPVDKTNLERISGSELH